MGGNGGEGFEQATEEEIGVAMAVAVATDKVGEREHGGGCKKK